MDFLTRMRIRPHLLTLVGAGVVSVTLATGLPSQIGLANHSSGEESLEYRVKAAYLLNFTRYVEWPSADPEQSAITICVLGADPFGRVLDATVAGRTAHGRRLEVNRIVSPEKSEGCEVVFVSRETWQRSPETLRALARAGTLTVGESEQFARRGGVIGFVIVDETVRFVINDEARDRAGLRISSRMLSLATAIYGRSGP